MRIVYRGSDKRSRYHRQNNLTQKSGWIFQHVLKIYKQSSAAYDQANAQK